MKHLALTPPAALPPPLAALLLPLAATLLLGGLVGCGKKSDPLPPIRYIPAQTRDLSIHQQGQVLIFSMAYPQTTSSGQVLPGLQALDIYEMAAPLADPEKPPTIDERMFTSLAQPRVRLQGIELTAAVSGDRLETRLPLQTLSDEDDQLEIHAFAVRMVSNTGEESELSNIATLVVRPEIERPGDFQVQPTASGIALSWQPSVEAVGYNVYRRPATDRSYGSPLVALGKDDSNYLDEAARYGTRYIYSLRAVASQTPLVESAPAAEREVDYRDRFAPAPPTGLIALGERGRIRVIWERSVDSDVVGYKVYRRFLPPDGTPGQFNPRTRTPVAALEHLDDGLASGQRFEYRITAVDNAGNEGEPSETVIAAPE